MIDIKTEVLNGKEFETGNGTTWICIGVSHPYYVVGIQWDQASNRTTVKTFKFDDIKFKGQLKV